MNPIRGIIGALTFLVGMLMFFVMWTPLVSLLPAFLCSETMAMADIIWGMILLIPALTVLTGIVVIISAMFEPSYPQQGY